MSPLEILQEQFVLIMLLLYLIYRVVATTQGLFLWYCKGGSGSYD
jgi:hypothetical protein